MVAAVPTFGVSGQALVAEADTKRSLRCDSEACGKLDDLEKLDVHGTGGDNRSEKPRAPTAPPSQACDSTAGWQVTRKPGTPQAITEYSNTEGLRSRV